MSAVEVTEHVVKTERHTTSYLSAGPSDGPLLVFVHGWPELALSWRHQLPVFAALGFHCVAPDMRGYGRSSVPTRHEDYALEEIVADMLELLAATGHSQATWIGHDWGSGVVWALAAHHPEACVAVASLCVPYGPLEQGVEGLVALVDRSVYPVEEYPAGQWEYMYFYQENFARATAGFEASTYNTCKALFRAGSAQGRGKPSFTSQVRRNNGWFGPPNVAPDVPRDANVLTEAELRAYSSALARNGFFGADSYYMNSERNAEYAKRAVDSGRLSMPVLFLAARFDYTCETIDSALADPMRERCTSLDFVTIDAGHWLAQEKPVEVNGALAHWLATKVAVHWPQPG